MGREADMIIDLINKEKSTQMNKLQDGSFTAFNGYRAIYFRQ